MADRWSARLEKVPRFELQSLLQCAVTSWPRQLAMMLANPTAGDTEAMRRVGDAMLSRDGAGVVAAHCCYLLSEQPLDAAPPAEAGPPRMLVVGHDAAAGAPPTWALQATEIGMHDKATTVCVGADAATNHGVVLLLPKQAHI